MIVISVSERELMQDNRIRSTKQDTGELTANMDNQSYPLESLHETDTIIKVLDQRIG